MIFWTHVFLIHQICVWHPLGSRHWTIYLGFDYVLPKLKELTEYADRRESTSLGMLRGECWNSWDAHHLGSQRWHPEAGPSSTAQRRSNSPRGRENICRGCLKVSPTISLVYTWKQMRPRKMSRQALRPAGKRSAWPQSEKNKEEGEMGAQRAQRCWPTGAGQGGGQGGSATAGTARSPLGSFTGKPTPRRDQRGPPRRACQDSFN